MSNWQTERIDPKHTPWFGKKTVLEHQLRYSFAQKFVKNKTVIDLGCGIGYGSYMLANASAKKVYGLDIDRGAIKQAKHRYLQKNITYILSDSVHTGLSSSVADVIVAFEIIEHLKNPKKFIQEVTRLLKPNGVFILSTPNSEMSFGDNPYHIKEFSLNELKKLLSTFSIRHFFGQHKVNKKLISFYKSISLRFRPWENPKITPLQSSHEYLYFVVVCKKVSKSSSRLALKVE